MLKHNSSKLKKTDWRRLLRVKRLNKLDDSSEVILILGVVLCGITARLVLK